MSWCYMEKTEAEKWPAVKDFGRVFEPFKRVIVTGPQRSGTQICARIIAHETGKEFVGHASCHASATGMAKMLRGENIVIHQPGVVAFLPVITNPDAAIVFVHRDDAGIQASIRRINWRAEPVERLHLGMDTMGDEPTAPAKLALWRLYVLHKRLHNPFSIRYADLATHSLWIPQPRRAEFGSTQWKEGEA